jgi:RNA polymerase sigma-70 factor (sigma-E family)
MGTRDPSAAGPGLPVRRVDGYAAAALPDEIDLVNALEIRDGLCAVIDSVATGLIVDMSATSFCDSTGLAVLRRAYRRAQARGVWPRLVVPHPHVRKIVRLVALDGLIPVHTSVAEAVAAARREAAGNRAAAQPPRPGRVPGCAAPTGAVPTQPGGASLAESKWDADRAVTTLYAAHYRCLVRLAFLLVCDLPTAEDVVQDSFVAMHGGWRRLQDTQKALFYLRQTVLNRSRSVSRHRRAAGKNAPKPAPGAGHGAIGQPERNAIVAALQDLPHRQREALVLRYYADLPEPQISQMMGISRGAASNHTARGMSSLRAVLEAAGRTKRPTAAEHGPPGQNRRTGPAARTITGGLALGISKTAQRSQARLAAACAIAAHSSPHAMRRVTNVHKTPGRCTGPVASGPVTGTSLRPLPGVRRGRHLHVAGVLEAAAVIGAAGHQRQPPGQRPRAAEPGCPATRSSSRRQPRSAHR